MPGAVLHVILDRVAQLTRYLSTEVGLAVTSEVIQVIGASRMLGK